MGSKHYVFPPFIFGAIPSSSKLEPLLALVLCTPPYMPLHPSPPRQTQLLMWKFNFKRISIYRGLGPISVQWKRKDAPNGDWRKPPKTAVNNCPLCKRNICNELCAFSGFQALRENSCPCLSTCH